MQNGLQKPSADSRRCCDDICHCDGTASARSGGECLEAGARDLVAGRAQSQVPAVGSAKSVRGEFDNGYVGKKYGKLLLLSFIVDFST